MSKLLFLLPLLMWQSQVKWETDLDAAIKMASEKNKTVLLNFSGSDWCAPCIQMKKNIFNHPDFISWSAENLVLVNADFPRSKKNKLTSEQQMRNERMAEQYNRTGIFPLTVLLNPDGSIRKSWEGMPKLSAAEFVEEIRKNISHHP